MSYTFHGCNISQSYECSKEANTVMMQMQLNYDLDPRAQWSDRERKEKKGELVPLFQGSAAPEPGNFGSFGQALRNTLSCNVNKAEL